MTASQAASCGRWSWVVRSIADRSSGLAQNWRNPTERASYVCVPWVHQRAPSIEGSKNREHPDQADERVAERCAPIRRDDVAPTARGQYVHRLVVIVLRADGFCLSRRLPDE